MELGIYSFGDRHPDPRTGAQRSVAQTYTETLERIRLADQLGLVVTEVEPFGLAGSGGSSPMRLHLDGDPAAVFAKLFRSLAPGGSLWVFDLVECAVPELRAATWRRYGEYLESLNGPAYRDAVWRTSRRRTRRGRSRTSSTSSGR